MAKPLVFYTEMCDVPIKTLKSASFSSGVWVLKI